jgi:hypothetical protein
MPEQDWGAPSGGHLNGQPVGPTLPDPVPCEGCGRPVWWTDDATAVQGGTGTLVSTRGVWELDLAPPPGPWHTWALRPHACPLAARRRRRVGLLTGEDLDDDG